MTRKMKDSGIEWIGLMPDSWSVGRIGQLYTERKQKVSDRDYPPLSVTMKGIVPQLDNAAKTDAHDDRKLVCKGDFAINSRSDRRGSCGISPYDGSVSLINTILKPRNDMHPVYYDWLFHSTMFSDEFYKWGHGIVNDLWTTNWQEMKKIYVPIPSFEEQSRIASFLDSECSRIDAVFEKTQASIEEYKKLKQAIITQAVTKGIRTDCEMKNSGIDWIGEIPLHWKILNLGSVTNNMRNGYVGPTRDLFVDEGVRYIQSLHIKNGTIDFSVQEYYVTEKWANNHPKIRENDILIVQTGDIGNVGLVGPEYDGCNCHALIIATPNTDLIIPKYLTYYLRSHIGKELILYHKTGALLPHLNSGKIKFTRICCPNIQEQKEIISFLDSETSKLDVIIEKKEKLLSELESYKRSLIYEYVTGKKEVPA